MNIILDNNTARGPPWAPQVAQWEGTLLSMQKTQETQIRSLGGGDALEDMATHWSILPGKSCGQRSLAGYS